jgi:hypothetical protein
VIHPKKVSDYQNCENNVRIVQIIDTTNPECVSSPDLENLKHKDGTFVESFTLPYKWEEQCDPYDDDYLPSMFYGRTYSPEVFENFKKWFLNLLYPKA